MISIHSDNTSAFGYPKTQSVLNKVSGNNSSLPRVLFTSESTENQNILKCLDLSKSLDLSNISLVSTPRLSASNNNVYVVWEEGKGGKSSIVYRHSNNSGTTFGPATSISSTEENESNNGYDGTPYDDLIYGRNAAENINGLTGNDIIFRKGGDDNIQGAQSDDKLYGEKGDDILMGSYENDYLSGGSGKDQLYGGDHDDTLRGGKGANFFNCGNGFDVVVDFDAQNGDTRTKDCEIVNVVNHD